MFLFGAILLSPFAPLEASEAQEVRLKKKPLIGWVEKVRILPGELELKAKIDTGAKSSSLHAPKLHVFERDGEKWVAFELRDPKQNKKVQIEKIVYRTVAIKRKGTESQERLVILMHVCLANEYKEIEVNLADRTGFNYQVLIGRRDLSKIFRVNIDPSAKFTRTPRCPLPESLDADAAAPEK